MRGRARLLGGALAAAMLLAACGSDKDKDETTDTSARATTATATPMVTPTPLPGDPPAGPVTARLDRLLTQAKLASNVAVVARRDLTNDEAASGQKDILDRFTTTGRETGTQYAVGIDGTQRVALGINQYATPEGARAEFDNFRLGSTPEAKVDVPGLGDDYVASRVALRSGGTEATATQIVFIRGRYLVSMADFDNDPKGTPDAVIAIARAIDTVLQANPVP